ncbi:glycosyltransferase family 4 protein [Glycomyces harbinensis]|uniref:Glycosyltransferase involved in cell wall bisynthesis n=1 Tax=Glycomyces harbinensis TaxID=58114 RepID=A0A1G6UXF6_9ACTN|nr:glycosyltransferase family 4 protein [Glycomyces harbinensis]SDD45923.1 Glycosyltransferase involved in cell wall bisynthesis [Glycomyces harbinensis]
MKDKVRLPAGRRVVMLVDNSIDGDSRVQKAAKSMAEAGWDVHLIGRAEGKRASRFALGGATAHLRVVGLWPGLKPLRQRLAIMRYPFAHVSVVKAEREWERRRFLRTDLAQRRLRAELRAQGRGPRGFDLPVLFHRLRVKLQVRWLRMRLDQTKALGEAQKVRPDGGLERFETAYWKALLGDRCWRRLDPWPLRFELGFGPLIDQLKPDLIHVHDYWMIGVGVRAAARAGAKGRKVPVLYDAHEFLPGVQQRNRKWQVAKIAHEREFVPYADAVVTVSPRLAELLVENHRLAELPTVVLNSPPRPDPARADWTTPEGFRDVRQACGLDAGTPLMVYCGSATPQRGLHLMVESLALQPDVHAAFVIGTLTGPYVDSLRELADRLGVADRVHLMPYVPYDVLTAFLATADVGVHPLETGLVNHEVGLNTKFYEFMHAGLPIVISDVKVMSEETRRLGIGEVFRYGDVEGLARAARTVIDDRPRYTKPFAEPGFLDEFTWEAQAARYDALYRRLLGTAPSAVPQPRSDESPVTAVNGS